VTTSLSELDARISISGSDDFPVNSLFRISDTAPIARKLAIKTENYRQRRAEQGRKGANFPCIFLSIREISGDGFAADCSHRQTTQAPFGACVVCGDGWLDENPLVRPIRREPEGPEERYAPNRIEVPGNPTLSAWRFYKKGIEYGFLASQAGRCLWKPTRTRNLT
jgi:hypothetical protein